MDQLKEENLEVGGDRRRLRAERDEARGEAEVRNTFAEALFWQSCADFRAAFSWETSAAENNNSDVVGLGSVRKRRRRRR